MELSELNIYRIFLVLYINNYNFTKQEWSSMESNLQENWDEIEMLFGHLRIGNW